MTAISRSNEAYHDAGSVLSNNSIDTEANQEKKIDTAANTLLGQSVLTPVKHDHAKKYEDVGTDPTIDKKQNGMPRRVKLWASVIFAGAIACFAIIPMVPIKTGILLGCFGSSFFMAGVIYLNRNRKKSVESVEGNKINKEQVEIPKQNNGITKIELSSDESSGSEVELSSDESSGSEAELSSDESSKSEVDTKENQKQNDEIKEVELISDNSSELKVNAEENQEQNDEIKEIELTPNDSSKINTVENQEQNDDINKNDLTSDNSSESQVNTEENQEKNDEVEKHEEV